MNSNVPSQKDIAMTPMMKQYMLMKEAHPDALLMMRLGDFYEFFGEDAEIAAEALDIVLTARGGGDGKVPMCGVPQHALEQYMARLVQKGFKVAICEQLEDPKTVKGLVKRGVVRIVTPGTAMEVAEEKTAAIYLAALVQNNSEHWAISVCEMSTGVLRMTEFKGPDALEALSSELIRLKPRELLFSEADYLLLDELLHHWFQEELDQTACTMRPANSFERNRSIATLSTHFAESLQESRLLWETYPLAGDCAAAILNYLVETQNSLPGQIRTLALDLPQNHLLMDPTTFRNLEITRNLRNFEKKGSLFDLLDETKTAAGSRLLREWIERPLIDVEAIKKRHDAVEGLVDQWSLRQSLRDKLKDIYDMERLMTRVVYQRATPKEMLALKQSFSVLPEIKRLLSGLDWIESFYEIESKLDTLEDLHDLLQRAIEEILPANWKEGGFIKNGYHPQADAYRRSTVDGRQWMLDLEKEEKEKTGIKSLKIGFNKVFGYYFEVTKSNLHAVPNYFQRKQTLASGERFVTDELIRLEGLVLGSEEKMISLELELYQEIMRMISQALPRIQETAQSLARLDTFQALAEAAVLHRFKRPMVLDQDTQDIFIKDLRHPVVEHIMDHQHYVPNDLFMSPETTMLIITGPNMGGKSTYCRSVALAFVLAQMGSFIPATEARLPVRERVFARVGASDDLRGGQSTFMMEMKEVAHILKYASSRSLVILDEVGRGTGTYDGFSVAWAVSEYLIEKLNAKTLFATHYLELTKMAESFMQVKNMALLVEEEGERIIFLHKILPGSANKSYGIHVAKLAGLPAWVIDKANQVLSELEIQQLQATGLPEISSQKDLHEQDQLQLFSDSLGAGTKPKDFETELLQEIKKKNLMHMTPIEALNYLVRIQKKLVEE